VRTAVVVGAGVAGLATAGALARSGWQVTLLERGERLRGLGGAQLLWPNGLAALASMGLDLGDLGSPAPFGGIRRPDGRVLVAPGPAHAVGMAGAMTTDDLGGRPDRPIVYQAGLADGHPIQRAPIEPPERSAPPPALAPPVEPVVVHAADLHALLLSGLGDRIEIRTGIQVTTLSADSADWPSVGTGRHSFQADLVVVADGAESVLRRRLAPTAKAEPAGYTTWRAVVPWFRAPKLPDGVPAAGEMLGAGMRFAHATLSERWTAGEQTRGGVYWFATTPGAPRPEPIGVQLTLLRRWFADWRSPAAELLEATQADDLVPQPALYVHQVPQRLGQRVGGGGIVLVGDAAHAITPSLSHGACLALEDAAVVGALMRSAVPGADIGIRLDEYTRLRRDRVVRLGRIARRLDRLMQAQGRLTVAARDAVLGRFATAVLDRAVAAATDWQPMAPAESAAPPAGQGQQPPGAVTQWDGAPTG
jgi:2-polyprenyl-6-methoxyphenol hydroxylase-like FAD-dependent oxidoreductase